MTALWAVAALAQEPATQSIEAGETVRATVDSLLVPRTRADELVALAQIGQLMPQVKLDWEQTIESLRQCSVEQLALSEALERSSRESLASAAEADRLVARSRRQRDIALVVSAAVGAAATGLAVGVFAGR